MAACAEPGCAKEGPSFVPRLAFTSTGLGGKSAKVPRHPKILLCLPLPTGCLLCSVTEGASFWLYSSTEHKLHRVGREGLQRSGLLLSPRLIPQEGECSTQKRCHLWYWRMTQQRDPGGCPFSSLSRATNPKVSLKKYVWAEPWRKNMSGEGERGSWSGSSPSREDKWGRPKYNLYKALKDCPISLP